jgi:hypothetical protein
MLASTCSLPIGNAHAVVEGIKVERPMGPRYWTAYFDALATGPLLAKPHTARHRAGEMARSCPYPDVAAAGLTKVRTALKAQGSTNSAP